MSYVWHLTEGPEDLMGLLGDETVETLSLYAGRKVKLINWPIRDADGVVSLGREYMQAKLQEVPHNPTSVGALLAKSNSRILGLDSAICSYHVQDGMISELCLSAIFTMAVLNPKIRGYQADLLMNDGPVKLDYILVN